MSCTIPLIACFNLASLSPQPIIETVPFNLSMIEPPVRPDMIGWWSQYAEQPSYFMLEYRGWDESAVDGYIAVPDCKRVGDYAEITINDSDWKRVRVFDCMGADGDPSWWTENNIIGEIWFPLADEEDVVGQGGVKAEIRWE